MAAERFVGLISGTSVDSIDAALVEFDGEGCRVTRSLSVPFARDLRNDLLDLSRARYGHDPIQQLGELDTRTGEALADATLRLLAETQTRPDSVRAIGSHGQTIRHAPTGPHPFTLQIGDPNVIAARTGIPVVADFRRLDVAEGGQGAPLVPAFHAAMLRAPTEDRAILNLGGIANLTLLPVAGDVRGFDTGPANTLLDAWYAEHHDGRFDVDGTWAAGGTVDETLLNALLDDPYFRRKPPKSTGFEDFHLDWLRARPQTASLPARDVQATLAELSAASIADALLDEAPSTRRLLVCGGGVHNLDLLDRLRRRLGDMDIASTADYGLDPDFVEAAAFAWLARERLAGRPGNLPAVTGARRRLPLGGLFLP